MRPLRVAFLIPVFPELHNTFILNQIVGLLDRGHDVQLFPVATGDYRNTHAAIAEYRLSERNRHVSIPAPRGDRLVKLLRLLSQPGSVNRAVLDSLNPLRGAKAWSLVPAYTALSLTKSKAYDVLHVQFAQLAPLAERVLRLSGRKARLVTSFRGADTTSYLPTNVEEFASVFANGALFLPVSEDLRARVIAAGSPPERTLIHRSGVDLRRFRFEPRALTAGETAEVLFVGRFVAKKGIHDAVTAFAAAQAELFDASRSHAAPRARLTLVGTGPLEPELRRLAEKLGVTSAVRFAGSMDTDGVAAQMRASHILIAPSRTAPNGDKEGVPNVIKEAMATGMPVLSTLHGGIPELVEDGRSGYLVEEGDNAALTARLVELISSPERWAELGMAGRRKVEQEFDSDKLNDLLVERYISILEA